MYWEARFDWMDENSKEHCRKGPVESKTEGDHLAKQWIREEGEREVSICSHCSHRMDVTRLDRGGAAKKKRAAGRWSTGRLSEQDTETHAVVFTLNRKGDV
jgi:hypothetical protein